MLGSNHFGNIFAEVITIKTLFASARPSAITDCQGEFLGLQLLLKASSVDPAGVCLQSSFTRNEGISKVVFKSMQSFLEFFWCKNIK